MEPVVTDALPGSTLGLHVLVLSAWLHYGLGNTLSQIVEVFGHHLHLALTPGGLVQMWHRLAEILRGLYQKHINYMGTLCKERRSLCVETIEVYEKKRGQLRKELRANQLLITRRRS